MAVEVKKTVAAYTPPAHSPAESPRPAFSSASFSAFAQANAAKHADNARYEQQLLAQLVRTHATQVAEPVRQASSPTPTTATIYAQLAAANQFTPPSRSGGSREDRKTAPVGNPFARILDDRLA